VLLTTGSQAEILIRRYGGISAEIWHGLTVTERVRILDIDTATKIEARLTCRFLFTKYPGMDDYQIVMWIIAAAVPAVVELLIHRGE
jgi:hypothetical protein